MHGAVPMDRAGDLDGAESEVLEADGLFESSDVCAIHAMASSQSILSSMDIRWFKLEELRHERRNL